MLAYKKQSTSCEQTPAHHRDGKQGGHKLQVFSFSKDNVLKKNQKNITALM